MNSIKKHHCRVFSSCPHLKSLKFRQLTTSELTFGQVGSFLLLLRIVIRHFRRSVSSSLFRSNDHLMLNLASVETRLPCRNTILIFVCPAVENNPKMRLIDKRWRCSTLRKCNISPELLWCETVVRVKDSPCLLKLFAICSVSKFTIFLLT